MTTKEISLDREIKARQAFEQEEERKRKRHEKRRKQREEKKARKQGKNIENSTDINDTDLDLF